MTETYEGWSNRPTWSVNLWLSNTESLYGTAQVMARTHARSEHPVADLADQLQDWVTGWNQIENVTRQSSLAADLMIGALALVDWREIAKSWLEAIAEEQA